MRSYTFHILLITAILSSCHSDLDDKQRNANAACKGIACTEEFRTVTITVNSPEGNPVALDEIQISITGSSRDITEEVLGNGLDQYREDGVYPVFNDLFVDEYRNEEIEVLFSGYIDSEEVISEIYKVGADCCHVYFVSGKQDVIVE